VEIRSALGAANGGKSRLYSSTLSGVADWFAYSSQSYAVTLWFCGVDLSEMKLDS
jgi:hypothetical protein